MLFLSVCNGRGLQPTAGRLAKIEHEFIYAIMSRAGSGRSWVRMQPAELATMQNAASHLAARSRQWMTTAGPSTATGNVGLTAALRRAPHPASDAERNL